MKIAVIGAGNVGRTLGGRWTEAGHEVLYGVRDASTSKVPNAVSVGEASAGADILVFCTPWPALQAAARASGDASGKVVVDCTNPIAADFSGLDASGAPSASEHLQGWMPGAKVVKAFNTIGYNVMADPQFGNRGATLLVCGDDDSAKQTVMQLGRDIGFEPENAGPLSMAGYLEHVAWVWIAMAAKYGYGRDIAFHLDRR